MASLPSPSQVAGPHYNVYEAYYLQIDPQSTGTIAPLDAARFLKKSKLSDIILGKIWDLSDPHARGFLDKQGFFVALKLCALAQSGRGIAMDNITATDVPQPKMGDIPKLPANKLPGETTGIDWSVKPSDKAKYDQLFDTLQPVNGFLPGKKVRGVLMESKLPVDILGKIWDLADIDKDGNLSKHEFMIAMHLVYKALEKHAIPNSLPPELLPPGRRKESTQNSQPELIMPISRPPIPAQPVIPPIANIPPQPSRPPLPPQPQPLYAGSVITQQPTVNNFAAPAPPIPIIPSMAPVAQGPTWVVTVEEKAKYDALFSKTDADRDGFVSGHEIKDVFLQSGVPQAHLAHIWSLCDTSQTGKLNNEQFALAMWLIYRKVNGIEPPAVLAPEMVPPSLRTQHDQPDPVSLGPQSTPELDMLACEIRDLKRERMALERDVEQKEAELNVKGSEVRNLQSELDTLAATLKQLENQKGEAQKRLNDLKTQKSAVELELSEVILEVEAEQTMVDKLRNQADEQEASLRTQESELNSKKQELEGLKQEEQRLERSLEDTRKTLEKLADVLQESQLQISQVKSKVNLLEETQKQMNDAIAACEAAVTAGDSSLVPDTALSIGPEHRDTEVVTLSKEPESKPAEPTFNGGDKFDEHFSPDSFANVNQFESSDPFTSAFGDNKTAASSDPFGAFGAPAAKSDPFDPFNANGPKSEAKAPAQAEEEDPFGCDPFANLHAPTRPTRPESPSPALPPKKAKQPPPRPAPPRPAAPSMRAAPVPPTPSPDPTADPFASSGFGNFANFDGKFNAPSAGAGVKSSGGLKPLAHVTSSSSSASPSPVAPPSTAGRYETFEFTEDPFKNYRYEDVFNIADPFSDEASSPDPFSSEQSTDAFEPPFPKSDKFDVNDLFGGDFAKADLVNGNKNILSNFSIEKVKHRDNNANAFSSKTINVDPFLTAVKAPPPLPKLNDKSNDFDLFSMKKSNTSKTVASDDLELAWAAKESLKLEEERRKREDQEKSDLALAIALSKKENSEKGGLRSLLRRNKNTPTT